MPITQTAPTRRSGSHISAHPIYNLTFPIPPSTVAGPAFSPNLSACLHYQQQGQVRLLKEGRTQPARVIVRGLTPRKPQNHQDERGSSLERGWRDTARVREHDDRSWGAVNKQGQETAAVIAYKKKNKRGNRKNEWPQTDREGEEERVAGHTDRAGPTHSCRLPPGKRGEQTPWAQHSRLEPFHRSGSMREGQHVRLDWSTHVWTHSKTRLARCPSALKERPSYIGYLPKLDL